MILQAVWFFLIVILLAGYAILDGFDFGVGFWHFFAKNEDEKRIGINAIAPVWDGNEVWLLTGGGALFAAFPPVYACIFSGFYLPVILLIVALIFRAISIEFRGQIDGPRWKRLWDMGFALGSTLPPILLGVVLGNLLRGLPLDEVGNYTGTFWQLLNPFSLLVGIFALCVCAAHGALYLALKTDGESQVKWKLRAKHGWLISFVLLLAIVSWAGLRFTHLHLNYIDIPLLIGLPLITLGSILMLPYSLKKERLIYTFLLSSLIILAIGFSMAISLFPHMVYASNFPELSLTIFNASSSQLTLTIMLVITLTGMPMVIFYTAWVYRVFKGKAGTELHY